MELLATILDGPDGKKLVAQNLLMTNAQPEDEPPDEAKLMDLSRSMAIVVSREDASVRLGGTFDTCVWFFFFSVALCSGGGAARVDHASCPTPHPYTCPEEPHCSEPIVLLRALRAVKLQVPIVLKSSFVHYYACVSVAACV